jgi:hypothetical protein
MISLQAKIWRALGPLWLIEKKRLPKNSEMRLHAPHAPGAAIALAPERVLGLNGWRRYVF